jgi:hypothetical protein
VESVEKQKQLSHSFHRPLEISPTARDSHIPTAGLRCHGKAGDQHQVSHFPTAARDDDHDRILKTKKRKEVGRNAASASFNFRIILYWKRNPFSGSFFD